MIRFGSRLTLGLFCLGLWLGSPGATSAGTFEVNSRREAVMMKNRVRAAQFLHHATFGPTIEEIDTLANRMRQIGTRRACSEWIDDQFDVPPNFHLPLVRQMFNEDGLDPADDDIWPYRFRHHAWWHLAVAGEDQLRQRMAWALAQILVTSDDVSSGFDRNLGNKTGEPRYYGVTSYYDLLVRHAFGNYRDLLRDVTYNPIMGLYLSHMKNRKTNGVRFPDENYAREIMQLFSIGLYELNRDGSLKIDDDGNQIPTYDNDTIKNFARVFTGLTFDPVDESRWSFWWSGNDPQLPMRMFSYEHDTEPKTLLGGEVIDLDDGDAEIEAAIDNLFAHPNVGPFISYRLIQRLVKSNPSRAYIDRVARVFNDNGSGEKGDLKAVLKAILLDAEAFRGVRVRLNARPLEVRVSDAGTESARLREPLIRYVSMLRAVHVQSDYPSGRIMMLPKGWALRQEPYKQPSVFNFYLPSYQPPGEITNYEPSPQIPNGVLVAPEFQMQTAVNINNAINLYLWHVFNSGLTERFTGDGGNFVFECNLSFDFSAERAMAATDEDLPKLIDHFDLVFCCGTMPQDYKDLIVDEVIEHTSWMPGNPDWSDQYEEHRVQTALIGVVLSPYCAVGE